jgi:hypothetical protein
MPVYKIYIEKAALVLKIATQNVLVQEHCVSCYSDASTT